MRRVALGVFLCLVALGCEGPQGPPGDSGAGGIAAVQIDYTPVPGSPVTATEVQGALDQLTQGYLPLSGGTAQSLTITNRLDAPLARSRVVIVRCSPTGVLSCEGVASCPAGADCPVTGTSSEAQCPTGFIAISGGCQSNSGTVGEGMRACELKNGTADVWRMVADNSSGTTVMAVCLSVSP